MDRYQDPKIILESLEESSPELHGFPHDLSAEIRATRRSQKPEPFKDEFLTRQLSGLSKLIQTSIANDFWQVDRELATILNNSCHEASKKERLLPSG